MVSNPKYFFYLFYFLTPLLYFTYTYLKESKLFRRWKKEKEEWNLANGINFSYTSPFMSDNSSIVKA